MERWTVNAPPRGWRVPDLLDLWRYRTLAVALARRDLKLRYAQTVLGVTWVIIQPVIAMAAFSLFLGHLAGLSSDGQPYPVFVLAGLSIWFFVSSGVAAAAESLVEHRELVEKVYFPRLLAPLGAISACVVDLGISLIALAIVATAYGVGVGPELLLAPVWLLGAVIAAVAVGVWLSALNVLYRDFRYALGYLLQIWLFVSPIVFASGVVADRWRPLFALNPLTGVIDGFRWSTIGGSAPPAADLVSLASGALLLLSGLFYFERVERRFADRI